MKAFFIGVLGAFGVTPIAAEAAVVHFVASLWRSLVTVGVSAFSIAYSNGQFASPHTALAWMASAWWGVLLGALFVPVFQSAKSGSQASRATSRDL